MRRRMLRRRRGCWGWGVSTGEEVTGSGRNGVGGGVVERLKLGDEAGGVA